MQDCLKPIDSRLKVLDLEMYMVQRHVISYVLSVGLLTCAVEAGAVRDASWQMPQPSCRALNAGESQGPWAFSAARVSVS